MPAHEAARCAGEQGRYWAYHDVLFERQPRFERDDLVGYAVNLDLDRERFERCLHDHTFPAAVEADFAEGRELGVRSTPTFLLKRKPLVGAPPPQNIRAALHDALRPRR